MWVFSKSGHFSIGQHASDPNYLVVHSQLREEMDKFVGILDAVAGERHEVQQTVEGDYRFLVLAQRSVVAQAVARMVTEIDHGRFVHSVHFDMGQQPGYLLWLNRTGLQVATVRS
jgi:hypothetical protein